MSGPAAGDGMDLDHVAIGLHDVADALRAFVGELGGVVVDGGEGVGFRNVQVRVGRPPRLEDPGSGMTVELMEPWASGELDFLTRFLRSRGTGPHHLTFKTGDIRRDLERLAAGGLEPVRARLGNPRWREAFFHPGDTCGTVVQVAESHPSADPAADDAGEFTPGRWWPEPPPPSERPAVLRRVVLAAPDLDASARLFGALLGGRPVATGGTGETRGTRARELRWPGGARLRIERRDGPAGIDRLECERAGPPGEHDELAIGGARVVVRTA